MNRLTEPFAANKSWRRKWFRQGKEHSNEPDSACAPEAWARPRGGLLVLATTALATLGPASQASADFTTGKCAGPNIEGNGASFAKTAQEVFNINFKNIYCAGTPGQGTINVAYNADGSGKGIKTMELRVKAVPFRRQRRSAHPGAGGADELWRERSQRQASSMTGSAATRGKVHVFPIAVGAVAPLVNFPEGCNPELLGDQFRTVSAAKITGRRPKKRCCASASPRPSTRKSGQVLENAKWSEAFPELAGDSDCEVPIVRVVRFDASGTTFAFKDYLRTIEPARGWTTTYESGTSNGNREWPGAEFGTGGQCTERAAPGSRPDNVDFLTSGCEKGAGKLVEKLIATDGSIGYADVATARNASPTLAINAGAASAPTAPYWTQVQNGSGNFTEPTADETNGYRTNGSLKPRSEGRQLHDDHVQQHAGELVRRLVQSDRRQCRCRLRHLHLDLWPRVR